MILHVTFSDGSNPWISLNQDRHTIAKQWRKWMKYHPGTAMPEAFCGNWVCLPSNLCPHLLQKTGFVVYRMGETMNTLNCYNHLGHALAALERLGGERL